MGAIGGLAGGPRKRRGGPAYYAKLARVRWAKAKKQQTQPHPRDRGEVKTKA
jgi:hypothetical protein